MNNKLLIPDYELLTIDGWKKINDITFNDEIASLNNNILQYNNPIEIKLYENLPIIMYKIENKDIDIDISLIHILLSKSKNDKEFVLTECKDLLLNTIKYKRNALINKKKFTLFNNKIDFFIQLHGIWFSNAWFNDKDNNYYISVNENTSHVLCNILNKLNYKYNIYIDNILLEDNYYSYLVRHYKKFPKWIWNLDMKQSRLFLDMILLNKYNSNINKINYKCENIDIMNDMMRLCINAGLSSTFNYKTKKLTIYYNYHEPIVNNKYSSIYNYNGIIYSIIIPNETIMVRKNGKTLWI